jgi:hypothetical protein
MYLSCVVSQFIATFLGGLRRNEQQRFTTLYVAALCRKGEVWSKKIPSNVTDVRSWNRTSGSSELVPQRSDLTPNRYGLKRPKTYVTYLDFVGK